ncbi:MAG: replication-associated recombination protein A, partial [Vicinamibacterales bacterium]
AVYVAYNEAADAAAKEAAEPVPLHLRNAPTRLMKELNYGKEYRYAHNEAEGVADMECLPPAQKGRTFYRPTDRGSEAEIAKRIAHWRKARTSGKDE